MMMVHHHRRIGRITLHIILLLCIMLGFPPLMRAQKAPVPAQPQPTGNCTHPDAATRPDCPAAIAFLAKLQNALKRDDRQAVASLVHYPLLVTAGGKRSIRSRAALLASFDRIFNATVRAAIQNATADDVWGNSRGFMIGRGVIWFDGIMPAGHRPGTQRTSSFRLITVNPVFP